MDIGVSGNPFPSVSFTLTILCLKIRNIARPDINWLLVLKRRNPDYLPGVVIF